MTALRTCPSFFKVLEICQVSSQHPANDIEGAFRNDQNKSENGRLSTDSRMYSSVSGISWLRKLAIFRNVEQATHEAKWRWG